MFRDRHFICRDRPRACLLAALRGSARWNPRITCATSFCGMRIGQVWPTASKFECPLLISNCSANSPPCAHSCRARGSRRSPANLLPLPSDVVTRMKTGFAVPTAAWMDAVAAAYQPPSSPAPEAKGLVSRRSSRVVLHGTDTSSCVDFYRDELPHQFSD